jgi:elongation factor P
MYSITDLRKGTLIQLDGKPYKVMDYTQKQLGRGGSIVNTKLKALQGGAVIPKTFQGADKIEPADVTLRQAQYLYSDDNFIHFMDSENFEQYQLPKSEAEDMQKWLVEGSNASVQLFQGQVIGIELPFKVTLKVVDAPTVVKGDTQSTVMKDIDLETGTIIQAPLFIKAGDHVIIDTRDGSYVERYKD